MAPDIVDMGLGAGDSHELNERLKKLKGKVDRDPPEPIRRLRAVLVDVFTHARLLSLDVEGRKRLIPQIAHLIRCSEFPVSAGHAIVAMRSACRQAGESWNTM